MTDASPMASVERRQSMSDLIDRQVAIDALMKRDKELRNINWYDKPYAEGECEGISYAMDVIRNMPSVQPETCEYWDDESDYCALNRPSAQPEPRWIPVEIKPLKEKKTYWVCTDTGYQCECRWTNNRFGMVESDEWGWSIFDTPQYTKVVAWCERELPEPYRKETENG